MHKELETEVAIIGGGVGGFAAALGAARLGKKVVLTEETDWIGGQFTSQAVPPDEHRWIEQFGCTQTYRQFRNQVRDYYRQHFPLTTEARLTYNLDPGNGSVSRLCADPRVYLSVMEEMLAPYVHSGLVTIITRCKATSVETDGDTVCSVTLSQCDSGITFTIKAPYFLDATECGDLLPMANVEYVTGAESQYDTGEPHAIDGDARPFDIQASTYVFAMDYVEGENHIIDKPADYDFWRNYKPDFWPARQLSFTAADPRTLQPIEYSLFPDTEKFSLYTYRRIIDQLNFVPGTFSTDITLVNWPQNDYWLAPIYDLPEEDVSKHLYQAKQLSLSLLYWMQTEAPRPDGKEGYPGLRLRPDVMGTTDGLAKYPYIRESRRMKAAFTVLEQHVSAEWRGDECAEPFLDTIGIGSYRIDLHPTTEGTNYIDVASLPFQIPLGALIPIRVNNLLPACKNIGTTHITNGCYRLHPVEWNIGESAGMLAAFCVEKGYQPREVWDDSTKLKDYQQLLTKQGVELFWPKLSAV
ncbi:FAD-dependent oxidoreductase [Brevibacillus laterosporus]|uniref:FAD-dependent oxidoreductase n=1 Tax=Brevibacillus laterosporus TaxID=1465 RepID=UPI00215C252C|nr:FAD-dependent oxidoreductase [Brevibacillus laterosporus]MCR8936971.1 FAD-dependent oxidoreductase [Brevibacillus laterosporus]MCZ0839609.1 FAD-dependent oxidoreductase [Brevibacillus laterosporus]MCZ0844716.1 FAD-dependent oxidoreductase [Brevibacillus laterosporus]